MHLDGDRLSVNDRFLLIFPILLDLSPTRLMNKWCVEHLSSYQDAIRLRKGVIFKRQLLVLVIQEEEEEE